MSLRLGQRLIASASMAAARLHPLERAVARRLREDGVGRDFHAAVVALSAGPDSTALLAALHALTPETGLRLFAFHVDHAQRGPDSDEDRRAARALARRFSVPFHSVLLRGMDPGTSEDRLREARYEAIAAEAGRRRTPAVFLGHHAGDLAETLLMRLIRGAGLDGLAGFGPREHRAGLWLLRPLIDCSRALIIEYLADRGIPYREDPSNNDNSFMRNRIRANLIPLLLENENPRIVETLARCARLLRLDADCLAQSAEEYLNRNARFLGETGVALSLEGWAGLHEALRLRVLREVCRRAAGRTLPPASIHLFDLQRLTLSGRAGSVWTGWLGLAALRDNDCLRVAPVESAGRPSRQETFAAFRRQTLADPAASRSAPAIWLRLGHWLAGDAPDRVVECRAKHGTAGPVAWELRKMMPTPKESSRASEDNASEILDFSAPPGARIRLAPAPLTQTARLKPGGAPRAIAAILAQRRVPPFWREALPALLIDGRAAWIAGVGALARPGEPSRNTIQWRLRLTLPMGTQSE